MEESSDPYVWSDEEIPPEASKLWREVGVGMDNSQTVVWKKALDSLDAANKYLAKNSKARVFTETYMRQIIGILVAQQPSKIGPHEHGCVIHSLEFSVAIIAQDLEIQLSRKGESKLLVALSTIFNKKNTYYTGANSWNVYTMSRLPEVRLRIIESFRTKGGFNSLAHYLKSTGPPSLDLLHMILSAIGDSMNNNRNDADYDDFLLVAQAVLQYMTNFTEDESKKEMLSTVRPDLQKIFDKLISVRRKDSLDFYQFWRDLALKLISSQSLPLRLFGWEQVKDLIDASHDHRPPPSAFVVREAGCTFVNGVYTFGGVMTPDGYSQRGVEISYDRKIPPDDHDGAGKHLKLFRCTMRSQQKWWFLSEADKEQPGTDKDIDYYQHKWKKDHEETEPPASGWITCRNTSVLGPPPKLQGVGLVVPVGQEYNTLEHVLAKWTIENKIVELVLGASLDHEVVLLRSIPLFEFLAYMCNRDEQAKNTLVAPGPNAYCLTTSHLLLAWKRCTSKGEKDMLDAMCHLLVSILPSLSNQLAIPLLQAIRASLADSNHTFVAEVTEFCGCLASHEDMVSAKWEPNLTPEVRAVVLDLLWAVLSQTPTSFISMHRSYDAMTRYATVELHVALAKIYSSNSSDIFLTAVTTLGKVLTNISSKPTEEKYRRVKHSNAVFGKRLGNVVGGEEAMVAAGFIIKDVDGESCYVMQTSAEALPKLMVTQAEVNKVVQQVSAATSAHVIAGMMGGTGARMPGFGAGMMGGTGAGMPGIGAGMPPLGGGALSHAMRRHIAQSMLRSDPLFRNNLMLQRRGGAGDTAMTEQEMLEEAIRRSLSDNNNSTKPQ